MPVKTTIQITFDKELLNSVDNYVEDIGAGATRSGFIDEAIRYYIRVRRGLKWKDTK